MPAVFDTPITTNDLSIERVLAAGLPVALVFLEQGGVVALNETLERLARENAGALLLAKVPLKENPASARRFDVARPPAIVTFFNGQMKSKAEQITSPDLVKHVHYLLGKGPRPEDTPAQSYTQQANTGQAPRAAYGNSRAAQIAHPINTTDHTFEQDVLRSGKPVLVDFWAPWCGPCRMTEPILEKLAREMSDRLTVAKVNVDDNPFLAQRYGIQSIPTMMLVRNGQIVDRWMGALPEQALRNRLAGLI